jgi:hypothetical protein
VTTESGRPKLRVGAVLDGWRVPRWCANAVQEIATDGCCELTGVLIAEPYGMAARPREQWLYGVYERLDRARFAAAVDALETVDLRVLLGNPLHNPGLPADLDVVVHLGSRPPDPALIRVARHGLWTLHHGDRRGGFGGAPVFAELFEGSPTTVTEMQVLDGSSEPRTIYRSFTRTDPVSLHRNRNAVYWRASHFPVRCLRRLHADGPAALGTVEDPCGVPSPILHSDRAPTNAQMVAFLATLGLRVVRRRLERSLTEAQWLIAYRRATSVGWSGDAPLRCILPPPGSFYADPFVIERGGRTYVFFEEHRRGQGSIAYTELGEELGSQLVRPALTRPYHLSYPYVFEHAGEILMLPETRDRRTVELYRSRAFPEGWELDRVLMRDIDASDATVVEHGGRWWMFVCVTPDPGGAVPWDELFLFSARAPAGPWRPHPRNPVVSDVRRARPAGHPYYSADALIRPAQDCSRAYGWRIVLNRIDVMTEDDYLETPVAAIAPNISSGVLGTHCINHGGPYQVLDVLRRRPRVGARGGRRFAAGRGPLVRWMSVDGRAFGRHHAWSGASSDPPSAGSAALPTSSGRWQAR